jgi:hypothetical protein
MSFEMLTPKFCLKFENFGIFLEKIKKKENNAKVRLGKSRSVEILK